MYFNFYSIYKFSLNYVKKQSLLQKSWLTLSCSAIDKVLCKRRMIQRFVCDAYALSASDTDNISAIPLRKMSTSPRSLDGY